MFRDASASSGRMVAMTMSIAVGIAAVAAVSTAYEIIAREINAGYLATRPATAEIQMDHVDEADLAWVRARAGVDWAEAGGHEWLRVKVGPDAWLPFLLFVVPDFGVQRIGILRLESGEWPVTSHGIVLERTAMAVAGARLGREITLRSPDGVDRAVTVAGVVHDPSVAPASQQQTVYGYATAATLRSMGMPLDPRLLSILLRESDGSSEATILAIAEGLTRAGHHLGEVRIPPRHHPHWGLMVGVINLLLSFSILGFVLSSILTATLAASFLAQQGRQIGVLKALGARDRQILVLYSALLAAIGVVAVAVGLPLGCAAGRALARAVGGTLNFDLESLAIPTWVYLGEATAGVGVPLAIALWPIMRAARRPVREAFDDHGVSAGALSAAVAPLWSILPDAPALRLALRNSLRRRLRLVPTLTLLAAAGALFITSLMLSSAWRRNAVDAVAERHFDVEIAFAGPQPADAALAVAAGVAGVRGVEQFADESVSIARGDGINLTHTFPDGGHGSLRLDAVRPESSFLSPRLTQGVWLGPTNGNATNPGVVLNSAALKFFPGLALGGPVRVLARGRVLDLKMIGVIDEHLAPATLYVASRSYAAALDEATMTRGLRVSLERSDEGVAMQTAAALERALDAAGLRVAGSSSKAQIGRAYGGHLYILVFTLGAMAVLIATVGVLGLAAAMGTSVLERTREIAVMRAIGAGRRAILSMVLIEGLCIGTLSVACASLLAIPVTVVVAKSAGVASSGPWQSIGQSAAAIGVWLAIVLVSSVVASAYPARYAARLTVRAALAYQ